MLLYFDINVSIILIAFINYVFDLFITVMQYSSQITALYSQYPLISVEQRFLNIYNEFGHYVIVHVVPFFVNKVSFTVKIKIFFLVLVGWMDDA